MKNITLKILASFLVASLCGAILTVILNQTVLNAHYLEGRFTAVNGYSRLSGALQNDALRQSGLSDVPQATATIQKLLSTPTVQQMVDSGLSSVQSYYQGKGSAPIVDFSNLATQARAAGVPLPQDSDFQPITLGGNNSTPKSRSVNFHGVSNATIATSVGLALLILALSLRWQRYTVLPSALISTGIFVGLTALVVYLVPIEVGNYIKVSGQSSAFISLGRDLAQSIGKDLAKRFGIAALVCLVVGITTRIWTGRMQKLRTQSQAIAKSQVAA